MEIKIDTRIDTKDELRKLAQFLLSLGDGSSIKINRHIGGNIFDDSSDREHAHPSESGAVQTAANAFAGMFGSDSSSSSSSSGSRMSGFDAHSLFKEDSQKEDDVPKIIPY